MTTATHLHHDESDAVHAHAHADVWLSDVTAGYGERTALEHVSVTVEPGSLLAVVGPNGAGKSTMLKLMAGLLEPWSGRIEILGAPAGRESRRVAYVPQAEQVDWALPGHRLGRGDDGPLPAPRAVRRPGRRRPRRRPRTRSHRSGMAASRPDADRLAVRRPAATRVPRPGARAPTPDLYLLDEPVTGVDVTTQEDLMDLLEAEAKRGRTVVATTHDLACAAQRFQQVVAMNRTVIAEDGLASSSTRTCSPQRTAATCSSSTARTVILDDAHHHDQAAPRRAPLPRAAGRRD